MTFQFRMEQGEIDENMIMVQEITNHALTFMVKAITPNTISGHQFKQLQG